MELTIQSVKASAPKTAISTSVPQEFLKHAVPDYVVRGTHLFSLRFSNKTMTTANTTLAVWYEQIKIIPIFCQINKKCILF